MASYEDINYSIRAAKHIERRMMVEALQRLRAFTALDRYRYVGFGSTYFADFTLVHRSLGIRSMISIERDAGHRARFLFNRPFRTVRLLFGDSNSVLPTLRWTRPSIVWLDYDGQLDSSVLTDVDWVCSAAAPGSVFIVSVNAHPAKIDPAKPSQRMDVLVRNVGIENVPAGVTKDGQLGGWRLAQVSRTIIDSAIRRAVKDRDASHGIRYQQLFHFRYQDGAKMVTVGGVILRESQLRALRQCGFDDLPFIRDGEEPYEISVPSLTNREVRLLDRHLPETPKGPKVAMIPERDRLAYAQTYRFFPTFVDTEF